MSPTPFPSLNEVLHELAAGIDSVLGEDLISICLQGSFATGDFDEDSDVDFIVATARALQADQVEALQDLHGRIFELPSTWAQHLEGSYFPQEILGSLERRGEKLWYLDNGSRELVLATHCNTAVVRQTVRQFGIVVTGAPPAALLEPVPQALLRNEIHTTLHSWGAEILADPDRWSNRFYQGFITLNYCRMWCDLTHGTLGSKRRGADWAKAHLDADWNDLIDRAWTTRHRPEITVRQPADPRDFARTLKLVRLVMDRCEDTHGLPS